MFENVYILVWLSVLLLIQSGFCEERTYYMSSDDSTCINRDAIMLTQHETGYIYGSSGDYTDVRAPCFMRLTAAGDDDMIHLMLSWTDFCSSKDVLEIYNSHISEGEKKNKSKPFGRFTDKSSKMDTFTSQGRSITLKLIRSGHCSHPLKYEGFKIYYTVISRSALSAGVITAIVIAVVVALAILIVFTVFLVNKHKLEYRQAARSETDDNYISQRHPGAGAGAGAA